MQAWCSSQLISHTCCTECSVRPPVGTPSAQNAKGLQSEQGNPAQIAGPLHDSAQDARSWQVSPAIPLQNEFSKAFAVFEVQFPCELCRAEWRLGDAAIMRRLGGVTIMRQIGNSRARKGSASWSGDSAVSTKGVRAHARNAGFLFARRHGFCFPLPQPRAYKKTPRTGRAYTKKWRRAGDSNPRYPLGGILA